MANNHVRKVLAPKIGMSLPKRLFPVYASFGIAGIEAGQELLAAPGRVMCPAEMIIEVSDAAGTDYYKVAQIAPGIMADSEYTLVLMNKPAARAYTSATVTIAGGHAPFAASPDHIMLEHGFNVGGARWTHEVHVDDFAAMFGDLFPQTLLPGAKPVVYTKLVAANVAPPPDATAPTGAQGVIGVQQPAAAAAADRGFQRFFDQWKAEGLIK
jgi:hypothetical protein